MNFEQILLSEYTYYFVFHFVVKFCRFSPCNAGKKKYFINTIKLVRIAATEKLSSQCAKFLPVAIKTWYKSTPGFWLLLTKRWGRKVLQDPLPGLDTSGHLQGHPATAAATPVPASGCGIGRFVYLFLSETVVIYDAIRC